MEAGGIEPPGNLALRANTPYSAPIADRLVTPNDTMVTGGTQEGKSPRYTPRYTPRCPPMKSP